MNEFKQSLKSEIRKEAPFTASIEQRILRYQPKKKRSLALPIMAAVMIAIIALALTLPNKCIKEPYLASSSENISDMAQLVNLLEKNELVLPLQEGLKDSQQLLDDADKLFLGDFGNFNYHEVIISKKADFSRGDYVAFENDKGDVFVRQIIAFKGESYSSTTEAVYINNKKLMLPGLISGKAYMNETNYHKYNQMIVPFSLKEKENQKVSKDLLIVSTVDSSQGVAFEEITKDKILGKVVALKKNVPTFELKGEELTLYEQFKQTLDTSKLVGVSPKVIMQMFAMASMEQNVDVYLALIPGYVSIHQPTKEEIIENMGNKKWTEEQHRSLYANIYNGLENAEVEISPSKESAFVSFETQGMILKGKVRYEMRLNAQKFWELRIGY